MRDPNHPRISVLMSVYNNAPHVGGAIESILRQTFGDFEFLIMNDGSTDGSADVIDKEMCGAQDAAD
ncbi:MAG: glycosyltransferase [Parasphingorhabdus sp.]|nr:glycosyltransferase [Parasphingorhabdus sp.]